MFYIILSTVSSHMMHFRIMCPYPYMFHKKFQNTKILIKKILIKMDALEYAYDIEYSTIRHANFYSIWFYDFMASFVS